MENSIALIVLSLILLILVVGLIFKKDFREDVLKSENENEADFRGFKLKGALFWVIYAATAFGTIYLAVKQNPVQATEKLPWQDCEPSLGAANNADWIAFDLHAEKPAVLEYGCCDHKLKEDHSHRNLKMDLALNDTWEIMSAKSTFVLGKLEKNSLEKLDLTNNFNVEKYIEISYDLQLNPFKATRNLNDFYDWNEYENLPFKVEVKFTSERGIHSVILEDAGERQLSDPLSLNDKWTKILDVNGYKFIIRLRARDTDPANNSPEYANFQIFQLSTGIF